MSYKLKFLNFFFKKKKKKNINQDKMLLVDI